jgi:two-component system, NtrC family, response regulator AtoC
MTRREILVVDDEPAMRRVLEIGLKQLGHGVAVASNGVEAAQLVQAGGIDLVITDLRMPEMDGMALIAHLRQGGWDTPVIMVTAYGTVESAVEAMKHGAADFLQRPFDLESLELAIGRVFERADEARRARFLRGELARGWGELVGASIAMRSLYAQVQQVAPTKAPVLIVGETGTGKELVARAVHNASPRAEQLFVPVNCAAIPAEMLESELFGYDKGAFTGAIKDRIGKFELASGGTLFLDELAEMPMPLQAKLLRVLQDNTIERLGSNRRVALDLRILAATNRQPRQAIKDGRLREDLYYRLNVFALELPSLRERSDDIPALVAHFVDKHGHARGQPVAVSAEAMGRLQAYTWPGNVRELENLVERALILSGGAPLGAEHFRLDAPAASAAPALLTRADAERLPTMKDAVEALESQLIAQALAQAAGNKARTAALLDISERQLWYKLKKYRL